MRPRPALSALAAPFCALAALAMLPGCNGGAPSAPQSESAKARTDAPAPASPAERPSADEITPEAAAALVARYGEALEAGDFAAAYAMWGYDGEASGMTEAEFAEAYGKYADIRAEAGEAAEPEGACGSVYVDVPLTLSGTMAESGEAFRLSGPMTLRRSNNVPDSTVAQLNWSLFRSGLVPDADGR